jgi:peptidoglycan/xylan/chitin deacetylase (PgdA/CDA1 family)
MLVNIKSQLIYLWQSLFIKKHSAGIVILTYHGIIDNFTHPRLQRNFHTEKQFSKHLDILKKRKFYFLNASELIFYIENPKEIGNKKLVCITFDDGYQNNLKAIEILNENKVPAIFFITTSCIDSDISIWTVNLSLLILEGDLDKINFNNITYSLSNNEDKSVAFGMIRNHLKNVDAEKRRLLFDEIEGQFPDNELQFLMQKHSYFKMLTWDEIRKVQNENIQFHSHGHFHEIHNQNQLKTVLQKEIKTSKELLEKNLKNSVFLFAYPNGNYNSKSDVFLQQAGYKAALILGQKKYNESSDKFSVVRITPNGKKDKFLKQIL